jgi:hypothetical protein
MNTTDLHRRLSDDHPTLESVLANIGTSLNDVTKELHDHIMWEETNNKANFKRVEFVDMLIAREVKRDKVKDAIIEKTLSALIWSALVFVGMAVWGVIKVNIGGIR